MNSSWSSRLPHSPDRGRTLNTYDGRHPRQRWADVVACDGSSWVYPCSTSRPYAAVVNTGLLRPVVMTDSQSAQRDIAGDFCHFQALRRWLERFQRKEPVHPSKQHKCKWRILFALLLHKREHKAADFPKGMLLIEMKGLCLRPQWELNDFGHSYASSPTSRISALPSHCRASSRLPNVCSASVKGTGLSSGGRSTRS